MFMFYDNKAFRPLFFQIILETLLKVREKFKRDSPFAMMLMFSTIFFLH